MGRVSDQSTTSCDSGMLTHPSEGKLEKAQASGIALQFAATGGDQMGQATVPRRALMRQFEVQYDTDQDRDSFMDFMERDEDYLQADVNIGGKLISPS